MSGASVLRTDHLVEDHLHRALEADDPAEKNYHVRAALQARLIDGHRVDPD